jgi:hypothetical protein
MTRKATATAAAAASKPLAFCFDLMTRPALTAGLFLFSLFRLTTGLIRVF